MSSREQFEAWLSSEYQWANDTLNESHFHGDDETGYYTGGDFIYDGKSCSDALFWAWRGWQESHKQGEAKCAALAAENTYLLNGAARELNTSWMFHKTMLGAQASLVCLSHGYQAAAREWLEGTTDEAGAEIPDDISVGELHEWFDSQMVSNDGNSGFLTRAEAEEAIKKACPATDAFLAEVRAQGVEMLTTKLQQLIDEGNFEGDEVGLIAGAVYTGADIAAQLRKGASA